MDDEQLRLPFSPRGGCASNRMQQKAALCVSFSVLLLTGAITDETEKDGVCSVDEAGKSDCCVGTSCPNLPTLLQDVVNDSNVWLQYVEKIERELRLSEETETGCWSEGVCGCYDSVVDDDLAVWKERGGIERTEFDAAKQYGVHYQIVNHTLRRQQDCLFSAR